MQPPLMKIKGLSKRFPGVPPHEALKDIHLEIPQGCIYGIIGMSGAGKSTLLRCLTGLETPSAGTFLFEGHPFPYDQPQALSSLRRQMGMVFQHVHLFSSRTAAENIAYPLEISGMPRERLRQRVKELLSLIRMEDKGQRYPAQLSGGEKQRVGIARALAPEPNLLLCDEPTSALDPQTAREVLNFLGELNRQFGLSLVIITHQLEAIKQICHRAAILAQGQIVEEGAVKELFTHPRHPATRRLLYGHEEEIPLSESLSKDREETNRLVRLGFEGLRAKRPLLSQMIKRYGVEANILSGGLDCVQETLIGHLLAELSGPREEVERALAFLRSEEIVCEVVE